jgi:hypothetical protein
MGAPPGNLSRPMLKPFLTANWRYLAMLNFSVDVVENPTPNTT